MTEELTYYCSENVFLSFLESKQLWLTSLSQSNDSAEGRWMRDYWLESFARKPSPAKRLERQGAAVCMDIASHDRLALGVCFSEERDLLSQWRGYAADGTGFSITFSKKALEAVAKDHLASKLQLTKIAYGPQDTDEIGAIVDLLNNAFGEDARLYNESNGTGSMALDYGTNGEKQANYEKAARFLFTAKNGAFREEKEWRLFTYGNLFSIDGVKLRGTGKAISPYIPITIPAEAVLQVTLGPTNQTPQHVLKFALKHNGLSEVNIGASNASYQAR
ncbi:DUF2971 domain-containing protein [Roseobacter sp. GAI101]|uniref:DUF2971 domain-containing protein n=1 Tax=Roseobacter sp. (strain GAI101) TaxID=391589 RepID=UPI0003221CCF|nr:DUF2971 domain-containing protein [Roseobacter sp. GAI101]